MSMKSFPLPSQNAWNAICRLCNARENVKSWLSNEEESLKDARREIDELGVRSEESSEYREAAARLVRAERLRDAFKERLKVVANKIDAAVRDAAKGEQKLFDDIDWDAIEQKPSAKEIYHADEDEDQLELGEGEKKTKPVGRPGPVRPEQPDPDLADGEDQHLAASVHELDVREDLKGKLIDAGLTKIAHLAKICDGPDAVHEMGSKANCDVTVAMALIAAVKAYRGKHRKAMREVESSEPSSGGLKLVGTASVAKPGAGAGEAAAKGRKKAK